MKHYKITNAKGMTRNETKWGENVTHEVTKEGNTLCSDEVLHGYKTPEMAVFMNLVHGNYNEETMLLWECAGVKVADDGTKLGFKKQTTIRQIEKPIITTEQRVEIGIKCAMGVYKNKVWRKWVRNWLNGTDRTNAAANAAAYAAYAAADAAHAAAYAAAYAAYAAADAAHAAAYAAADAAYAAADAAHAAADAAAYADKKINIDKIIKEVLNG